MSNLRPCSGSPYPSVDVSAHAETFRGTGVVTVVTGTHHAPMTRRAALRLRNELDAALRDVDRHENTKAGESFARAVEAAEAARTD